MKRLVPAVATSLALAGAAHAHHSRAPYDLTQEIVIEGTVAELDWKNPHIYMTVETVGPDGATARREIEVMAVSEARAMGLRQDAIAVGSHVVVHARPGRRDPGARALGLTIATSDGAVLPLNTDAEIAVVPTAVAAEGLAGSWAPPVAEFGRFFNSETGGGATAWPLTDAGRAAQAEAFASLGPLVLGICEPFPTPWLMIFPSMRSIEVDDAAVLMRFDSESGLQERTIDLTQVEHSADIEPSVQGQSIGRWEGETLVIDTVGFAPHLLGLGVAPSTPDKHVIERLSLTEDRAKLRYELTIEDPAHLAEPASFSMVWDHRPDLELVSEGCDPQTARRPLQE